jgi:hypothetical protein
VPDDDPRIAQCEAALSYWRLRSQLDRETAAGHLSADFAAAVEARFREYPYAGIAGHTTGESSGRPVREPAAARSENAPAVVS